MNSINHFLNFSSRSFYSAMILGLCVICFPRNVNAQWNYLNSPTSEEVYMEVVNKDTIVYSLGATGKIYHSFNGGDTWSESQTGLEYSWIYDFDFPTNQIGYGCGGTYFGEFQDVIIKTENAGLTWDTLTTNNYGVYTFNHIKFVNADTGFVASGNLLLKTENGGNDFILLNIPGEGLFSISTLSSSPSGILFISGSQLVSPNIYHVAIYRSDDLGENWQEVYSDAMDGDDVFNSRNIEEMQFPTPTMGYACGGSGIFLKSNDAGLTWTRTYISPFSNLSAIYFTSAEVGYINNAGGISKSIDGGNTWSAQNMNVPAIVRDIQFASANVGYAVTDAKLYKTVNAGEVMSISDNKTNTNIEVYPNPTNGIFSISNPSGSVNNIEIIDPNGRLVKTVSKDFDAINVMGIAPGTYYIAIKTDDDVVFKKLVVE